MAYFSLLNYQRHRGSGVTHIYNIENRKVKLGVNSILIYPVLSESAHVLVHTQGTGLCEVLTLLLFKYLAC